MGFLVAKVRDLRLPLVTSDSSEDVWKSQKRKQSAVSWTSEAVVREYWSDTHSATKPLAAAATPRLGPLLLPSTGIFSA